MASPRPSFAVTWDYLCPFARNAHEHLVAGLEGGAPWDVTFSPFSLIQAQNEVTADQAVLYCGATAAQGQSSASGYASGSSQMMQNLFGFGIG